MTKNKPDSKFNFALDFIFYTFGAAVYAFAATVFILPNSFAPGGITGISTILNHLFHLPVGVMIIVLNIPLFIWGWHKIGQSFLIKSAYCTVVTSVLIDVFSGFMPTYTDNKMLASLYGGVIGGFGLALVMLKGSTTGGTDILARLVNAKFPYISMGRVILIVDIFIIAGAVLAFGYIETGLYSLITIFASSRVIDGLLYGADMGKTFIIISRKQQEISSAIFTVLHRGATLIDAKGAYTGVKNDLILCAVRRNEIGKLHKLVLDIDPNAFIIVSEAGEILGEGFKKSPPAGKK